MVILHGWNVDVESLPGYAAPPEWWHGPIAELVGIPGSSLAVVVYNFVEIGMSNVAGNFAVLRDRDHPAVLFSPQSWLINGSKYDVQASKGETFLLIYIANARQDQYKEKRDYVLDGPMSVRTSVPQVVS